MSISPLQPSGCTSTAACLEEMAKAGLLPTAFWQDALLAAMQDAAVTEIWVAGGIYRPDRQATSPSGTGDRKSSFALLGGVGMYGGFQASLAGRRPVRT
jgi:hypothetical protein